MNDNDFIERKDDYILIYWQLGVIIIIKDYVLLMLLSIIFLLFEFNIIVISKHNLYTNILTKFMYFL